MSLPRTHLALAAAAVVAVLVIGTLAWLINNNDWGIVLIFLAPVAVWVVIRIARALDDWSSRGDSPFK